MDFICLENKEWIKIENIVVAKVQDLKVVFDVYYSDYYGLTTVTYRSGFNSQREAQDTLDYLFQFEISLDTPFTPLQQHQLKKIKDKAHNRR